MAIAEAVADGSSRRQRQLADKKGFNLKIIESFFILNIFSNDLLPMSTTTEFTLRVKLNLRFH